MEMNMKMGMERDGNPEDRGTSVPRSVALEALREELKKTEDELRAKGKPFITDEVIEDHPHQRFND